MLTDVEIKKVALPPKGEVLKLYDEAGLFLAVYPSGGKFWRMRFKHQKREHFRSLGEYPEITLAKARRLRDEVHKALRLGTLKLGPDEPPAEPKQPAPTFEEVARRWFAAQKAIWKEHHAADVLGHLEKDIFPKLGTRPVAEVTAPEVLEVVRDMEGRSVDVARRNRQRISAVFCFAIAEGLATQDPAAPILRALAPVKKGHRPAVIDLAPARALLAACEAAPAHPLLKLLHRMLVLTAVRPGEARGAEWGEFEGLQGIEPLWRVPAARMKMGREHLVPLAPAAVEVLTAARTMSGELRLAFPSRVNGRRPMSDSTLSDLIRRAGYEDKHVPHGWRATFSSIMNERLPADRAVIDLMLAHAPQNQVEAAYNRAQHMARRRELAGEWAGLILEGAPPAADLLKGARR